MRAIQWTGRNKRVMDKFITIGYNFWECGKLLEIPPWSGQCAAPGSWILEAKKDVFIILHVEKPTLKILKS